MAWTRPPASRQQKSRRPTSPQSMARTRVRSSTRAVWALKRGHENLDIDRRAFAVANAWSIPARIRAVQWRQMQKAHRPTRAHHLNRYARLGPRRSQMRAFGITNRLEHRRVFHPPDLIDHAST